MRRLKQPIKMASRSVCASVRRASEAVKQKRIIVSAIALVLGWCTEPAFAAPLPPLAPVDVCGEVRSARWLPPLTLAQVPGMSGSAGRERRWLGRFVIVLGETRGITRHQKTQINALLTTSSDGHGIDLLPGQLLLVLTADNPALLKRAARICVMGFAVSGDEGGTWTRYRDLRIVAVGRSDVGRP